jgi:hypothetical protein
MLLRIRHVFYREYKIYAVWAIKEIIIPYFGVDIKCHTFDKMLRYTISCPGDFGSKPRPRHQLFWLRFFLIFLSFPKQMFWQCLKLENKLLYLTFLQRIQARFAALELPTQPQPEELIPGIKQTKREADHSTQLMCVQRSVKINSLPYNMHKGRFTSSFHMPL